MRIVVLAAVMLCGCGNKDAPAVGSGSTATPGSVAAGSAISGSAATAGSGSSVAAATGSGGSGSAASEPKPAGDDAAGSAAPAVAAAGQTCCCESTGDATHYTIESAAEVCTGDGLRGDCVELKECNLAAQPTVLAVGTPVTVEPGGLVAIWHTKDDKAYGAVEVKPLGKHAAIRGNGSNGEGFEKLGRILAAPGPITVTAQSDGRALISNGHATWILEQPYRYAGIKFKKQK